MVRSQSKMGEYPGQDGVEPGQGWMGVTPSGTGWGTPTLRWPELEVPPPPPVGDWMGVKVKFSLIFVTLRCKHTTEKSRYPFQVISLSL